MTCVPGYALWCEADGCDRWAFEEGVDPQGARAVAAEGGWMCDDPTDGDPNADDYCAEHAHLSTRYDTDA